MGCCGQRGCCTSLSSNFSFRCYVFEYYKGMRLTLAARRCRLLLVQAQGAAELNTELLVAPAASWMSSGTLSHGNSQLGLTSVAPLLLLASQSFLG
jgi:hypothetical protein